MLSLRPSVPLQGLFVSAFTSVLMLMLPVLGTVGLVKLIRHRKRLCCSKAHIVSSPHCLILAVMVIFLQEARSNESAACIQWLQVGGVGGAERANLLPSHRLLS